MAGKRNTVKTLCFDPGNREILLYDGENTVQIDSVFKVLGGKRKPQRLNEDSSLLEYNGKRYLVGSAAKSYSTYTNLFNQNKYSECLIFLLPAIGALYPDSQRLKVKLKINASESEKNYYTLQETLVGIHEFKCDSDDFSVNIEGIEVIEEGLGAWQILSKVEKPTKGKLVGVINLGGATCDGILVESDGFVRQDSSFHSPKGGAYALANSIMETAQAEIDDANHVGLDVFMDDLKQGGPYSIFNEDYSHLVADEIDSHFKDVIGRIKAKWQPDMKNVEKILFTGGLTHLIKDRLDHPIFRVANDPVMDNCMGLLNL